MASDPIARVRRWLTAARRHRDPLPETMALATAGRNGAPAVRFVLLAHCDGRGLVFCASARSRKAREITAVPRAAVALYWNRAARQVRVEGRVEPITAAETDRYWREYSRDAQLATWAADEAGPEASRAPLERAFRTAERRFAGRKVPRPARWRGYRIVPAAIEFWRQGRRHLHHRERFERGRNGWRGRVLAP